MRLVPIALLLATAAAHAQTPAIKVNQLGFLPLSSKLAVVPQLEATAFEVIDADSGKPVFKGSLRAPAAWAPSGETVRLADFSALKTPGSYRIKVAGAAPSDRFTIGDKVYQPLTTAALKAYYFNRAGTALAQAHAGVYARAAGHANSAAVVHASAASSARPAGTVIAVPKGWYDAGDYNIYVANSGISTYTLLAAYEHFPAFFDKLGTNIPESGNALPDILDETLWNLEWMLAMQDPNDGGVYHKLTNLTFDGMVMPVDAMKTPRYVVAKSTAAAFDFAATMAAASRVFRPYEKQHPGLSARMLAAAEAAWQWAEANPARYFKNPSDVVTGEYGDDQVADERAWAAAELYITSGKDSYYRSMKAESVTATVPTWSDVRSLAWISLAQHRASLTPLADRKLIEKRIDGLASNLIRQWKASGYRVAMTEPDFEWGSNAVAMNQAMMLLQAYRMNGNGDYLAAAQSALDYVLGRNATGYSFVTGFGTRPALHPHHRPSQADGIEAPVPGFLTGGPQPGQQDKAECPVPYPTNLAATAYLDHACSFASNEVAINWNAPLLYVTAALKELTTKAPREIMDAPEITLADIARQESTLQFDSFSNDMALEIGLKIIELAREARQSVAVDIRRNGTQLFYHGMPGTSSDHADWIRRKNNLVDRSGHSSFYIHTEVKNRGGDYDAIPTLDPREYAAHGGAFPLTLRGTGQIGTITVSGLPGPEDHALVVRALQAYLKVKP
ncbi:heme-degrading domain-containing protein [Massilia sp. CF038]|uniref:heme-degrading domain-containing protein n=1 Tax=Massilia sp. CF038 TaxID=1881045 RepID=UPI00091F753C|nr:heme-degrading domain-containing protein [Massilia sp. CF038]SHG59203.1 non-processive endocellulase [Massilia sp. CF038]